MFKHRKMVSMVLMIALITTVLSICTSVQAASPGYTDHDIIEITSEDAFNSTNGVSSGTGTEEDPYIIEGWEIDGEETEDICIAIGYVDSYCIIRDCYIYGADGFYGVGIFILSSPNISIVGCSVKLNLIGVMFYDTSSNVMEDCDSSSNGITSPGGGGDPPFTGVVINNSNNITISNTTFYHEGTTPIVMRSSEYCTIENNNINENSGDGIRLEGSNHSTITGNYIANSSQNGIVLTNESHNNTIVYNNIINHEAIGVLLKEGAASNLIHHNNLFDNADKNAEETPGAIPMTPGINENVWDDDSEGNYWGDYDGVDVVLPYGIGDTPYNITNDGDTLENTDRYPLMEPYTVELSWEDSLILLLSSLLGLLILLIIIKKISEMEEFKKIRRKS